MKIRLFNHLCAGLVAIVLAASCSSPVKYTNAIPAESTEIVSIDLQSLAVKAGVNDPQNAETLQKLSQTLTSGVSADAQKALETILKKPSESGIDFAQPVYIFHSSETKQQGFIAAVANADKLKDMLQATQSETQMADVAEKDGYSFSYNDQAFVAFNASTLLVLPSADTPDIAQMHQNASNLLSQSSEQSINSQEAFRQMQETKGDIRVMMTSSSLFKLHPDPMLMAMADSMNLQNIKYVGGLSFEPGQVAVNVGYTSDDPKALELLEKQLKATRPIQNTFAPYFPQSTLLYFSLGLDGKELYTHLEENPQVKKSLSAENMELLKQLVSSFENDFTLGITGVDAHGNPTILAYAETNNADLLNQLYEASKKQGGNDLTKLDNDDYMLTDKGLKVYMGMRGKQLIMTNDEALYNNAGKESKPSLLENDFAKEVQGQRFATVINAEAIFALPIVKMATGLLTPKYRAMVTAAENISYLRMSSEGKTGLFVLQLKDRETNALKQIVDQVKTLANL